MTVTDKPPRRRSERARQAILESTRDDLATYGYDRLSIDRIAAAAKVGKQTVYRWYPSKNALVAECVLQGLVITPSLEVTDTGDTRTDIATWLNAFVAHSRQPHAAELIRAGTAAAAEDLEIAGRYSSIIDDTKASLTRRLDVGVDRGHLPVSTPTRVLAETFIGALVFKILSREPLDVDFARGLVDLSFPDATPGRPTPSL